MLLILRDPAALLLWTNGLVFCLVQRKRNPNPISDWQDSFHSGTMRHEHFSNGTLITMLELSAIQQIVVLILPVLFAITLHEAAHAFAAWRCGDNTAVIMGRLSLNPLRHIDFFGTILIPLLVLLLSGFHFIFGWAKPVPINSRHFKKTRRDLVFVSAAGPMANLFMAFLWACILKIAAMIGIGYALLQNPVILFFILTAKTGITINLLFAFLNLIPILPLDGGRIMSALLPYNWAIQYAKIEPYGFFILLGLLMTNLLTWMIVPPTEWAYELLKSLFYI